MPDGIDLYGSGWLLLGKVHDTYFNVDYYKVYDITNGNYGYAPNPGYTWLNTLIQQYIDEGGEVPDLGDI